jgi:hypothetical protein
MTTFLQTLFKSLPFEADHSWYFFTPCHQQYQYCCIANLIGVSITFAIGSRFLCCVVLNVFGYITIEEYYLLGYDAV